MTFKVQVGPAQITIHQGRTVLVCEPDGTIAYPSEKGLYFNDTRLIGSWSLYADGVPWDLLSGGATSYDASRIHLTNPALITATGPIPARTLGLVLGRSIHDGLREDTNIANYGSGSVRLNLEIGIRCDFEDVFEVRSGNAARRGSITTEWTAATQRFETSYTNADFHRSVPLVLTVVVWGLSAWSFFPAQQARLIALAGLDLAPVVLSLNASAMFAGFSLRAIFGSVTLAHGTPGNLGWVGAACVSTALLLTVAIALRAGRDWRFSHRPAGRT